MLRGKMSWKAHLQPQIKFSLHADKLECIGGECLRVKITFSCSIKHQLYLLSTSGSISTASQLRLDTKPRKTGLKLNQ